LRRPHLWLALALAAALIAPNLMWNSAHQFATFAHTADNAKWTQSFVNPGKALEFIGAQFGVMGPILFGTLLAVVWRARSNLRAISEPDRLLLAFSLPILLIVVCQAFLSRAHANWAVAAYISATVLVTGHLLRPEHRTWMKASYAINGAVCILIAIATSLAGGLKFPGVGDPFARMMGNKALAADVISVLDNARSSGTPYAAVLSDERELTASLIYYARSEPTPILAWRGEGRPRDHFELTRDYAASQLQPVLLVSQRSEVSNVTGAFANVESVEAKRSPAAKASTPLRPLRFYKLSDYRGRP